MLLDNLRGKALKIEFKFHISNPYKHRKCKSCHFFFFLKRVGVKNSHVRWLA